MKFIEINNDTISAEDFSVMDFTLARAYRDSKEKRTKIADAIVNAHEYPNEERDAHSDVVSTDEMKKLYLSESLFMSSSDVNRSSDIVSTVLDMVDEGALSCREALLACLKYMSTDDVIDMCRANEFIVDEVDEEDEEELEEAIDTNLSHAEEFIKTLRSAGFGDGFDQKLKIDNYSTGTRIEYADQGGSFDVTITDDSVTLNGHDEGEEPFTKTFTTWSDFVKEFRDLYPGVPVKENRTLCEATRKVGMIDDYHREDGSYYAVYDKREPLAYVIEAELGAGEIAYIVRPSGSDDIPDKVSQSNLPGAEYPSDNISVQWDEWDMPYVKLWGPTIEYFNKAIEVAKKYGKDYEIHHDPHVKGEDKYWLEIIVTDEDTQEPYYDEKAPRLPKVKKATIKDAADEDDFDMTGRHVTNDEDLEDSQRYPIESPAPAQTGLAMMEDVQMNGSLNEVRISSDGVRNFTPWGAAVEVFNTILENGKMDAFEKVIESDERFMNGIGATELNDMLISNKHDIYAQLGIEL